MQTAFRNRLLLTAAIIGLAGNQFVPADERTDLVLELEQQLQRSDGNKEKIRQVANVVAQKRLDVRLLIVCYASRNMTRVAIEMRRPPIDTDFEGKPIKFDETAGIDGGASQLVAVLIAAQTPQTRFRQEFAKLLGPTPGVDKISEVLSRAVQGNSVASLKARVEAKKNKWPFPFCLPDCDD